MKRCKLIAHSLRSWIMHNNPTVIIKMPVRLSSPNYAPVSVARQGSQPSVISLLLSISLRCTSLHVKGSKLITLALNYYVGCCVLHFGT